MKKWLKTIIPVFAFAFILLVSGIQAQAGTITSVNAEAGDNEFTVSGKAGDGVLSVVIFVYDSTGTKLLQMKSVAVDSNHSYTDTFEAEVGTYVVKVADYEGGAFKETSVTVASAAPSKYSVAVTSGGNGKVSASVTEAAEGTTVTLIATADSGYKFKGWTVESGSITLADSTSATTTFIMPAGNVSVKAVFEKADSKDEQKETTTQKETTSQTETTVTSTEKVEVTPVTEDEVKDVQKAIEVSDAKIEVKVPVAEAVKEVQTLIANAINASDKTSVVFKDKMADKIAVMDLTLTDKDGKAIQPEAGKKVKVTLKTDSVMALKDAKYVAAFRVANGKLVSLGIVEVKDGKFTIETDHFSTYVFTTATEQQFKDYTATVKADATVSDTTSNKTGDSSPAMPLAVLAAVALVSVVAVAVSKKRA